MRWWIVFVLLVAGCGSSSDGRAAADGIVDVGAEIDAASMVDVPAEVDVAAEVEVDAAVTGPTPDERFGPAPVFAEGEQTVADPFEGVRILSRTTSIPRPLSYHVVLVDTDAPGIDFTVTADNAEEPRETTRRTTREFVEASGTQLAFNAHFFSPWPPEDDYADLLGLSVSDGDAYSTFEGSFRTALAFDTAGKAHVVTWADGDESGLAVDPPLDVDDAVTGNERIVTAQQNTAGDTHLHPRTGAGVTADGDLVLLVVDGRQEGVSEGVTTVEMAEILLDFEVVDAINLDGGGSTTLVVADPEPRVVNVPVGYLLPETERHNGSNVGIYARLRSQAY
ncbi:MAG: phosphodiester glycosidase family protein [Myxococcota bacterium]